MLRQIAIAGACSDGAGGAGYGFVVCDHSIMVGQGTHVPQYLVAETLNLRVICGQF